MISNLGELLPLLLLLTPRTLQQLLALFPPHSLTTIFCACQFLALGGIPQVLHKPKHQNFRWSLGSRGRTQSIKRSRFTSRNRCRLVHILHLQSICPAHIPPLLKKTIDLRKASQIIRSPVQPTNEKTLFTRKTKSWLCILLSTIFWEVTIFQKT
jgi:hypothetical protein